MAADNVITGKGFDIKMVDINSLKPYANNPRQTSRDAINQVKKSIQENNFSSVIVVDKDYEIIAGHTRHEAALELGYTELPVFIAKDLDEQGVKRLRLLDNRLNELTPWDLDKLIAETHAIDEDMTKLFEPLMAQDLSEFDLSDDDYVKEEDSKYGNAIIQYIMIFDNEEQQKTWYALLAQLKEQYQDVPLETHASRVNEFIKGFIKDA